MRTIGTFLSTGGLYGKIVKTKLKEQIYKIREERTSINRERNVGKKTDFHNS